MSADPTRRAPFPDVSGTARVPVVDARDGIEKKPVPLVDLDDVPFAYPKEDA